MFSCFDRFYECDVQRQTKDVVTSTLHLRIMRHVVKVEATYREWEVFV